MSEPSKYRVLHELGAGGMGTIHKGMLIGEEGFQRPIVIKKLRQQDDRGHVRLFVDEARRYAVLDHENIGRIFDFERVAGELCIILEYIDGWSLIEYVERHRELQRFPDVDLSVFIVSRVCRALQYVYEKAEIVHRDISPSNIMMTREGTVKLIDFGIAALSGTRDSSLTGKPAYMAPEMVVELRADNRSDLFSLGAVLFEILTRERLFGGATTTEVLEQVIAGQTASPRTYNPDIPDDAMAILRRALQRDPDKRFASAGEMGEACEHFLYDKGYGPTNLTLKQYVNDLFPPLPEAELVESETLGFPVVDPTLFPIADSIPRADDRAGEKPDDRPGEKTPASPLSALLNAGTRKVKSRSLPETLAPDPTRPNRRIKKRAR